MKRATTKLPEHRSDTGNAQRFVRLHGKNLRYRQTYSSYGSYGPYRWYVRYNGQWHEDKNGNEVMRRAQATIATLFSDAARMKEGKERTALIKFATASENLSRLKAMIALARDMLA